MKTKIIIGSILAVFILSMLPSISAVEYDAVEKANEQYLIKLLKDSDIDPKQQGVVKKLFWLIMRMLLLPIRIIKKIIRLICCIIKIPIRITMWILDIITPFRDFHFKKCRNWN